MKSLIEALPPSAESLAVYLAKNGFSGNIGLNSRSKNFHAIRKLVKKDPFYTFGISEIERQVTRRKVDSKMVRNILVEASGLSVHRFNLPGAGFFEPLKSAKALLAARERLIMAATEGHRAVFATGHPGAMTGFLDVLASWYEQLGGVIMRLGSPVQVDKAYYLDMIGNVCMASDNASNYHTHETQFMDALLDQKLAIDLVVGDHGFVGSALNHGIFSIGFYDTDDPALPLAEALGLAILSVPINDNRYNILSAQLARFLIGTDNAQ